MPSRDSCRGSIHRCHNIREPSISRSEWRPRECFSVEGVGYRQPGTLDRQQQPACRCQELSDTVSQLSRQRLQRDRAGKSLRGIQHIRQQRQLAGGSFADTEHDYGAMPDRIFSSHKSLRLRKLSLWGLQPSQRNISAFGERACQLQGSEHIGNLRPDIV